MDDFVGRTNLIPPERMRALTRRSDRAGWLQTGSHAAAVASTSAALWLAWGTWWAVPLFLAHGVLINFLYAAQHELGHYSVFKTRWLNDLFARIAGVVRLVPRDHERLFHARHHRHTQDWDNDPELFRAPFTLRSYLLYMSGITYWIAVIQRLVKNALGQTHGFITGDQRRMVMREAQAHLVAYAGIAAVSVAAQSWLAVIIWLAPMLATKGVHNLQNVAEHTGLTHDPDVVINTRTIPTCGLLRWLGWNMQYHTAHHTFPAVPFHALPDLHAEIVARTGVAPPTEGYLSFHTGFLRRLWHGPEPRDGFVAHPPPAPGTTR